MYRMFYFFFELRSSKENLVVIWLIGGFGCSSELVLFYENGFFKVVKNFFFVWNEYGWDQVLVCWNRFYVFMVMYLLEVVRDFFLYSVLMRLMYVYVIVELMSMYYFIDCVQ